VTDPDGTPPFDALTVEVNVIESLGEMFEALAVRVMLVVPGVMELRVPCHPVTRL
jgi:hypothetical protein